MQSPRSGLGGIVAITSSKGDIINFHRSEVRNVWIDSGADEKYPYTLKVLRKGLFIPEYYYVAGIAAHWVCDENDIISKTKFMIISEILRDLLTINNIRSNNVEDEDYEDIFGVDKFQKRAMRDYDDGRASLYNFNLSLRQFLLGLENNNYVSIIDLTDTIQRMNDRLAKYIAINYSHLQRFFNIQKDLDKMGYDKREIDKNKKKG